jgi:hypothetical protein
MANIYVRSTDGNDADNGSTWALAKATLSGAVAIAVAGDTIWVSQVHAESTAAPIVLNPPGTIASPVRILCGNDGAEPPTALAMTASISTTGGNDIQFTSIFLVKYFYVYGLNIHAGVGSAALSYIFLNRGFGGQLYEACTFHLANTNTAARINITGAGGFGNTVCKDCHFQFSNASQHIQNNESVSGVIRGGSIVAGTTPAIVFVFGESVRFLVEGFDLSNCGASMDLCDDVSSTNRLAVRNCKLPDSWSGQVNNSTGNAGSAHELMNAGSVNANYRYHRDTGLGTINSEQTVVRSGGASDGLRSISWKMIANTFPEWKHLTHQTTQILYWNNAIGSPRTMTIEILHDSVTNMTNQQIWLEVQYLGTSDSTLSSFLDDSSGDYLSTASDQADSNASWTTTGLTNPNTQKLSVTFTPQEKGFLSAIIKVAMASKTVYVCPKLEMS